MSENTTWEERYKVVFKSRPYFSTRKFINKELEISRQNEREKVFEEVIKKLPCSHCREIINQT